MEETRKSKVERLENALLEYIERQAKDTQPEIAATIPAAAMVLVELWKIHACFSFRSTHTTCHRFVA